MRSYFSKKRKKKEKKYGGYYDPPHSVHCPLSMIFAVFCVWTMGKRCVTLKISKRKEFSHKKTLDVQNRTFGSQMTNMCENSVSQMTNIDNVETQKSIKKKDERTRTWTFVLYPESAPENWRTIITSLGVKGAISPVHNLDLNPDGSVKKEHYHVVLTFDGNKSFEQIKEITDSLNAPIPQKGKSIKGLVRYFTHIDNPEKVQYSKNDIVAFGGFDIGSAFEMTQTDKVVAMKEIIQFCFENEIYELSQLVKYCIDNNRDDWFEMVMMKHTIGINAMLKSYRHAHENRLNKIQVDSETGEILEGSL